MSPAAKPSATTAMPPKTERRAVSGLEARAADAESAKKSGIIGTLRGYAAKFNCDSVPLGGFIERIAPGAFKRTLVENPDVVALWNHDSGQPVARAPQTLSLSEDETGLRCEISLADTADNRDLLTRVQQGIVRGMSFGFTTRADAWVAGQDGAPDLRTLVDVDLFEVSPVTWPAYPDTEIATRAHAEFRSAQGADAVAAAKASADAAAKAQVERDAKDAAAAALLAAEISDRDARVRIISL